MLRKRGALRRSSWHGRASNSVSDVCLATRRVVATGSIPNCALGDLENLLDRALRTALPAARVEARRTEAAAQLEPYRKRMERATYEQTLDSLLAKLLREECGLPRLSLFYL